jgi:hypothetical protein
MKLLWHEVSADVGECNSIEAHKKRCIQFEVHSQVKTFFLHSVIWVQFGHFQDVYNFLLLHSEELNLVFRVLGLLRIVLIKFNN